jgi:phage gp46-like protein
VSFTFESPGTDEVVQPDRGRGALSARKPALSDVRLFHGPDGGDIEYVNGQAVLGDGLETAVYLSLFGGNQVDSGRASDDSRQWWGNLTESSAARKYRSEFQYLLARLPATTGNLVALQDAALRDLAWMSPDIARSITVVLTMPALNRVRAQIQIETHDGVYAFSFSSSWAGGR